MADAEPQTGRSFFVRYLDAASRYELFLVAAVASILVVRGILALSGWPQLGGGKIHFAHLLWGGLGMLIGVILFIGLQGRLWRQLATLGAGIGFGLFIDELGKFITSDNDYFFRPVVAIIYLLFVTLFLLFSWIGNVREVSPQTALVNAFDIGKEAAMRDLDQSEKDEALRLLAQADPREPMVAALTTMFERAESRAASPNPLLRAKSWLSALFAGLARRRWFRRLVVGWFIAVAVVQLVAALVTLGVWWADAAGGVDVDLPLVGSLISGAVTGALVVLGLARWHVSRLAAYHWFRLGALVTIFVGEFFAFYRQQFSALLGLVVMLVTLGVIRSLIAAEEARTAEAGTT